MLRGHVRLLGLAPPMVLLSILIWLLASGVQVTEAKRSVHHVPKDFATIQEAVDAASSGDIIQVARGVYSGPVLIDGKSGLRLFGRNSVLQGSQADVGIMVVNSDRIRIQGFIVDGFHTGIVLNGTDDSRIHNVETRNNVNPTHTRSEAIANHDGLQLIASDNNLITNVFAHDNGHNGITLKDGSSNNILRGNTTNDNGKHPSMVDSPAGCGVQISRGGTTGNNNNTITDSESLRNAFGILVSSARDSFPGSSGNLIEGNEVHLNGRAGIDVRNGSSGNFIIDNDATGNAFLDSGTFDLHDEGALDNTWEGNEGNSNF